MKLDLEKVKEIYGSNCISDLHENIDELLNNAMYLEKLGFKDIYNIIETYPYIFLIEEDIFKERIKKLINKLGINYQYELDNNMSLWEEVE